MKLYKVLLILTLSLFLAGCYVESDYINTLESAVIENTFEELTFEQKTELLVNIINDEFPSLNAHVEFLPAENGRYEFIGWRASIDYNSMSTNGWVVHSLSRERIPLWLSSGIEIYAMSQAGLVTISGDKVEFLDNFGDKYFTPHDWGSEEHKQAIIISYKFVRYLQENSNLQELVSLYIDNNTRLANEMAGRHFYNFSGLSLDTRVSLKIRYSSIIPHSLSTEHMSYAIYITLEHAEYRFISDRFNITRAIDFLINYAESTESGVAFINDFHRAMGFDVCDTKIIVDVFFTRRNSEAWGYGGTRITINHIDFVSWELLMHEFWHVITGRYGMRDDRMVGFPFYPFNEGMAEAIWKYYRIENEGSSTDIFNTVHRMARTWMPYRNAERPPHFSQGGFIEGIYPQFLPNFIMELSTYITAESFTIYLLETHGKEKFSQVYFHIENFENVYGITLQEMIDRWLEFLEEKF